MYSLVRLASAFSRDEVEAALSKPMSNGKPLTLQHFFALAGVHLAKERSRLFKLIRRDNLSARELATVVRGEYLPKRRTGGKDSRKRRVRSEVSVAVI